MSYRYRHKLGLLILREPLKSGEFATVCVELRKLHLERFEYCVENLGSIVNNLNGQILEVCYDNGFGKLKILCNQEIVDIIISLSEVTFVSREVNGVI